jgi:glucose-1-phosphatase
VLEALILDLGNVLVFHDNTLLFEKMASVFGTTRDAMRARLDDGLWEKVNTGRMRGDALRQELNERLDANVSEDVFYPLWNCHFTVHSKMVKKVESLVGKYRLVLLSNTHDLHVRYLRPLLPVLEKFDGLVLSCEEGVMKPDAKIYELALGHAKCAPQNAVFFDDVDKYVQGAKAVGLNAFVFTDVDTFERDLATLT